MSVVAQRASALRASSASARLRQERVRLVGRASREHISRERAAELLEELPDALAGMRVRAFLLHVYGLGSIRVGQLLASEHIIKRDRRLRELDAEQLKRLARRLRTG